MSVIRNFREFQTWDLPIRILHQPRMNSSQACHISSDISSDIVRFTVGEVYCPKLFTCDEWYKAYVGPSGDSLRGLARVPINGFIGHDFAKNKYSLLPWMAAKSSNEIIVDTHGNSYGPAGLLLSLKTIATLPTQMFLTFLWNELPHTIMLFQDPCEQQTLLDIPLTNLKDIQIEGK